MQQHWKTTSLVLTATHNNFHLLFLLVRTRWLNMQTAVFPQSEKMEYSVLVKNNAASVT